MSRAHPPGAKLYLVVRADLPPGLQAAQLVHAATVLCFEQPDAALAWHNGIQNVVCLTGEDEREDARSVPEPIDLDQSHLLQRAPSPNSVAAQLGQAEVLVSGSSQRTCLA